MKYAIAPNGIFWSLQGEAHLRGFQMMFVRLAGCSVGCPMCDTDYSVYRRMTPAQIVADVREAMQRAPASAVFAGMSTPEHAAA